MRLKANAAIKGSVINATVAIQATRSNDEVSVGLSDEERTEFYRGLKIITDNLTNISSKYDK